MEGAHARASSAASSSDEDFYAPVNNTQDAHPAHPQATTNHAPDSGLQEPGEADDGNDSSSEMDLSTPSPDATPEPPSLPLPDHAAAAAAAAPAASNVAGTKRRLSDSADTDEDDRVLAADRFKKRKIFMTRSHERAVASPTAKLPVEIWQRIFQHHLSPIMLSRCLRVCKNFHLYLTAIPTQPAAPKKNQGRLLQPVDSESIWTQSRKNFFTALPRPLNGLSELQMLQLIAGGRCQFCNRQPVQVPASSYFNAGPGPNGLRVIWPFRIRSCGQCLEHQIMKDVKVLEDAEYAPLRYGVTHGFRSPELHFASESLRQMPGVGGIPSHLRFSKMHYKPELDAIKEEAETAKALGDGAADEWRKGLVAKGKEAMADCARWEKWELQMRPGTDLAQVLREYDLSSFPRLVEETQSRSAGVNGTQPPLTVANGTTHPLPQPVHVFGTAAPLPQPPMQHYPQQHFHQHMPMSFQQPPPQHFQPQPQQYAPRSSRSLQEAEQAKQSRKADIERRCMELEPPLEPNVLQHMESFRAAMLIAQPMTDEAWETLKPRILAQREAAELSEHMRASQLAALQAAIPMPGADDFIQKPAKETLDREYEQAQEPLRKTLGEYADDYINGHWQAGKLVDKNNAPIFAVHVLLQVAQRYQKDSQLGALPKFEPPKRKETGKQGTPPLEPFLSLDNMKWVYDNKVRPLTDGHRRELFLCHGCSKERNAKWFAFEGLIQHYGAKHTSAFSKGNIVVHWQTAQWPEEAPFNTNPMPLPPTDRRSSDYKSHGRARHTPKATHEGPFAAPSATPAAPEYSYHAPRNGYAASSQGHHGASFASPQSQAGPNGYIYSQQGQAQPAVDMSHDAQVTKLSADAREVWDALDGVKDLLESVRIQTVVHHAVARFMQHFGQMLPHLDLLTDALASNTLMRPLKNAHGLFCKSCVGAQPTGNHPSYWIRTQGAKKFNTSTLITHFKITHQASDQAGHLNWSRDMIELPENQVVNELLRTPGMDDKKLSLVAAAFPKAFPSPLPRIGTVSENSAGAGEYDDAAKSLIDRLARKSQPAQKKKKAAHASNVVAEHRGVSQDPLPEPREDEYDPRRPMFVQPALDPAQFDTDARKPQRPQPPASWNWAPETVAGRPSLDPEPVRVPGRQSRSPSVGRTAPAEAPRPQTGTADGAPDISAILAALTGQTPAQTAAPSSSNMTGSAASPPNGAASHRPQYERPVSRSNGSRRSSGRHDATYQSPNDPLAALQAALSQNTRQFEQNQHHAYVESAHVTHAPTASRPQYAYEDNRQYSQRPAHTPTYMDAPVQYLSYPRPYEGPKIYVDQYGHQLIPVESAPAPVQYAPNPYDQQQSALRRQIDAYTNAPPQLPLHSQPVYDERRSDRHPVYYEPETHAGNGIRYAYDDGRASVPRS